jgi:hypothetical protein
MTIRDLKLLTTVHYICCAFNLHNDILKLKIINIKMINKQKRNFDYCQFMDSLVWIGFYRFFFYFSTSVPEENIISVTILLSFG